MHRQFGHSTSEKLKKLIKSSNIDDRELLEIIDTIDNKCQVCMKYKKTKLRPSVGFSLSKDFNDVVAVDLKPTNGIHILHIIDHATRFSAAAVVKSKRKEEIVDAFIKHWIAIFGAPGKILSDNGGEFNNDLFRELGEQFNIVIMSTPAESPWSNGIVERHNAVLGKMVHKLMLDEKRFPIDVIVAWSVSAKNALNTCYGYSPNQLVFGRNPNFPSNLTNNPPAMEDITYSELVSKHLCAMHEARKAFIEAESNDKLRRALKTKTRVTTGISYDLGDLVYYKRKDSEKWKGPGKVIGKENKQLLVKHGGHYICVHPCSLQLIHNGNSACECDESNSSQNYIDNTIEKKVGKNENIALESDDDNDFYPISNVPSNISSNDDIEDLTSSLNDLSIQSCNNENATVSASNTKGVDNPTIEHNILPKVKSKIIYFNPDSESWNEALVLGRAGKCKGKNKTWFNLKDITADKHISVDFNQIKGWKNLEEDVLIADSSDNVEILEAKQAELRNWTTHNVYEEVDDNDQKVISLRWVLSQKYKDSGIVYKARLVARGFEEEHLNELRKDSPTCCKVSFCLVVSIIATNMWTIHSVDVKSAFLQGK